jgi:iron complex outermembrane receptor protein
MRNAFNTNPPFSNQYFNWQAGYNPLFSDPLGRTFYGRLSYKF